MIKLIVGLGNPGTEYEQTRHNAGFWFIDKLVSEHNIIIKADKKFFGFTGKFKALNNQEVHVLMPQKFMNLSGQSVQAFCQFYKLTPEEILVAHDELDLPVGAIRLKQNGGAGGHNGLKDIVDKLSSPNFNRLRIGIGHPKQHKHPSSNTNIHHEVHDYVLNKPNTSDKTKILEAVDLAFAQLDLIIAGQIQQAMKNLHSL